MLEGMTDTNVIFYLMAAVTAIGILAKGISHMTLRRLVRASANMQKSTHKLMKLVRAKYEHACLAHVSVDNTEAFVEKFIHEYRTLGLRLHTWQRMERLSIWFLAVLAAGGAALEYGMNGPGEVMYRYGAAGGAGIVFLLTLLQLSDETYKLNMIQVYMVDYLENVYAHRYQRSRQPEKEKLNIINPEVFAQPEEKAALKDPLPIRIEGEPRRQKKEDRPYAQGSLRGETAREAVRSMVRDSVQEPEEEADFLKTTFRNEDDRIDDTAEKEREPELKTEAIRHILEEFLA